MKRLHTRTVNRIKSTKAFTLAEALVAIIIVLLVTAIVAAGIPAAVRAYEKVVVVSNAELLLSNTTTALRNELGMARDVTVDGKKVTYYNPMFDSFSQLNADGTDIKYKRFAADGLILDTNAKTSPEVVFSSGRKTDTNNDLHITYDSVEYKDGIITFKDLKVTNKNGNDTGVTKSRYSIRVVPEQIQQIQ